MAKQDAISLLKQDHENVRQLFQQLGNTGAQETDAREDLLAQVIRELEVHTQIEEEILYPAYRDVLGDREAEVRFHESFAEHGLVDELMPKTRQKDSGSAEFEAMCKVLFDVVSHHLEEEESHMFPRMRDACSRDELNELGQQLLERKQALMPEAQERPGAKRKATDGRRARGRGADSGGRVAGGRIDLNKASAQEIERIEGIGPTRAQHLVDYRQAHGPFHTWEELQDVPGFDAGLTRIVRDAAELKG